MKYQVYVKKEIKSEADLPKEAGYYSVWEANSMNMISSRWYIDHSKYQWNNIVSYLQPIELDIPDDADITDEFTKEHYTYDIGRHLRVNKDRIFGAKTIRDKIEKPLK